MRLADDARGRVPFALVGVVLLLGATGYAATLAGPEPTGGRATTTRAVEEAVAAARVVLRRAVHRAAQDAAAAPLIRPGNTTYGRLLRGNQTFRRYFRLRVAVEARQLLSQLHVRAGSVDARVALPEIEGAQTAAEAIRGIRIHTDSAEKDRLRVQIAGITVRVFRGDRAVVSRRYSPSVTVKTPLLHLHNRSTAFQRALNRSPLESGFARRLTARLSVVAWTRGYAQWAGAPIENVLANRHLEVAANGALLATQRATFGSADQAGERRHRCAAAKTGVDDLLGAVAVPVPTWTRRIVAEGCTALAGTTPPRAPVTPSAQSRRRTLTFDSVADAAATRFLDGTGVQAGVKDVVRAATSVEFKLVNRTRVLTESHDPAPTPAGWSRTGVERKQTIDTVDLPPTTAESPAGWAVASQTRHRVTLETTVTQYWEDGNRTRTTTGTHRRVYRIAIRVLGRANRSKAAPGPLTERTRAEVVGRIAERGTARLIAAQGGVDGVIRGLLNGSLRTRRAVVPVPIDAIVFARARGTTLEAHRSLREEGVEIPRTALLDPTPSGHLSETLGDRRAGLLQVDPPHSSLQARARAAAERAYLDRVQASLSSNADAEAAVLARLGGQLESAGVSATLVGASHQLRDELGGAATTENHLRVAGVPPYLLRTEVEAPTVPGLETPYHPLLARNVNHVAIPWGSAADALLGALLDRARSVSLDRAARTYRGAEVALGSTANGSLRERMRPLRGALREAIWTIRTDLVRATADHTALEWSAAESVITAAMESQGGVADQALAASNGSLAPAVFEAIANRTGSRGGLPLRFESRIRATLRDAVANARPAQEAVAEVSQTLTSVVRAEMRSQVRDGGRRLADHVADRWTGWSLRGIPAGLPLTPLPGGWYATVSAWTVTLRGAYHRFAVSGPTGNPLAGPAGRLTYVRENRSVMLDVDGDGRPEPLGRNAAIGFAVNSAVVVAVPPGGRGVGDTDGVRNESSPGWRDTAGNLYRAAKISPCCWSLLTTPGTQPLPNSVPPSSGSSPQLSLTWVSRQRWSGPVWTAPPWTGSPPETHRD